MLLINLRNRGSAEPGRRFTGGNDCVRCSVVRGLAKGGGGGSPHCLNIPLADLGLYRYTVLIIITLHC